MAEEKKKTNNQEEWTEEDAVEYLESIGIPIGPDGTPLGIGWED